MIPTHQTAFEFIVCTKERWFEIFHSHIIFGVQPKLVWKAESSLIRALPKSPSGADFRRTIILLLDVFGTCLCFDSPEETTVVV